jgi:hypothetical protein
MSASFAGLPEYAAQDAERALRGQGFGAEGAGGHDGAALFVAQVVKADGNDDGCGSLRRADMLVRSNRFTAFGDRNCGLARELHRSLPQFGDRRTLQSRGAFGCCCGQECPRAGPRLRVFAQPLQVGDGLLEHAAQDIHINDRAGGGAFGSVGHFSGGVIIVVAQFPEMGADLVRHPEGIKPRMGGKEAAVVGGVA